MNKVNLEGIDFKTINEFKYLTIPIEYCKDLNIGYTISIYEDNEVVCSQCNDVCITQTHYIGALNDVLCDYCLHPTLENATYYKEDEYYEDKNIRRLGLAFQSIKDNI